MKLRLSERAAEQIRDADAWWREHRAEPEFMHNEVGQALALLRRMPYMANVDHRPTLEVMWLYEI